MMTLNLVNWNRFVVKMKLFQKATPTHLVRIGFLVNSSIKRRIQKQGVQRGKTEYSLSYAKYRRAHNRNTNIKDLTFTGNMWASLMASPFMQGAKLHFLGTDNIEKAIYNENTSPFFNLEGEEHSIIDRELARVVNGV